MQAGARHGGIEDVARAFLAPVAVVDVGQDDGRGLLALVAVDAVEGERAGSHLLVPVFGVAGVAAQAVAADGLDLREW